MSDTVRTPFAMVPGWVIERVTNPTALRYYTHIAWKHANDKRHAFPSEAKLAEDLGDKLRTAQRAIKTLRDADALIITRNRRKDGHYGGNRYWLPMDDPREHASNMAGADDLHDQPEQRVPAGGNHPPNMAGDHAPNMAGQEPDPLKQPHPASNQTKKDQEDPDGSSSSDLLGELLDLSKARGERPPRTNSRSSTTGAAEDPGTSENSSAAGRDQPGDRDDVEVICQRIRDGMIRNGFKPPTITQAWRREARLLLDRDRRVLDKVLNLIDWCQDHHFWKTNIKSTSKFREQYDTLRLQALDEYQRSNERGPAGDRWGSGPRKQRNPVDQSVYDVDPFQQAAQEQATRAKVGVS